MKLTSVVSNLFLLSIIMLFFACGKKNSCVAGTGGTVTLACFPQHHGTPIYNDSKPGYLDTLFIKFSPASDFVTTTNPADYDTVLTGNQGDDFVSISNLKCGNYFVYMTGWDTLRALRVLGGIPYDLTATSGTVNLNVPVTEL